VNRKDAAILATNLARAGIVTWGEGDFSGDDRVTLADLRLLQGNFGFGTASPSMAQAVVVGHAETQLHGMEVLRRPLAVHRRLAGSQLHSPVVDQVLAGFASKPLTANRIAGRVRGASA
jgi:hypothetical protein